MDNNKYQLYPFEVYTYDVVDSTNAVAKRAIEMMGDSMDRSVHVAGEQTAGRGRNDRKWLNTEDAIMMTIVQSTKLGMNKMPILNLVAAEAVRNALITASDNRADLSIKWPNDIVTTDRMEKVCGILSEAVTYYGVKYAVIGIGVNLNETLMPQDLLQPATSIYLHTGKHLNLLDTVNRILKEFEIQYRLLCSDPDAFLINFSKHCISLGRHVTVISGEDKRYGMGRRLSGTGQLVVKFEDGHDEVIYAADVSLRNQKSVDFTLAKKLLPKRKPASNKGDHGRALVIAGSDNMPGAALMCTKACIRGGAGLTKALIPESLKVSFAAIPEAMLCCDDEKIDELLSWASVILIGCGMGVNPRTKRLLEAVLRSNKPCVIDADALNTMAKNEELLGMLHSNAIITPHAAEMGRLCGMETKQVTDNFSRTAIAFAEKYHCTVLLKSAGSIIVSPDGLVRYNDSGTSALAKGGSGDVLAGLVTAMAAQGAKPFDAATLGSYLLGISAEKALDFLNNRFVSATDIIDVIETELS